MLSKLWKRVVGHAGDSEAKRLSALVEAERRRQGLVEAQRRRDGGIYDPVLGRWVKINE